jgi:hypothetical protein
MAFGRRSFSHAHSIRQERSPDERAMQDIHEHYDVEIRGSERESRAIEKTNRDMQAWPHKPVSALDRDFGPQLKNGATNRSVVRNSVSSGAATDARFR